MDLHKYLKDNGISQRKFSSESGVSIPTLFRIFEGGEIYLSIAVKIEKATDGAVTLNDLMPTKQKSKAISLKNIRLDDLKAEIKSRLNMS